MMRGQSTTIPDKDLPGFGLADAVILAVAIALGTWVWATEPKYLESALGLGNHEAQFEAMMQANKLPANQFAKRRSTIDRVRWWNGELLNYESCILPFFALGSALATFRHRAGRSRRALRHVGILTTAIVASFFGVAIISEVAIRKSGLLTGPLMNPIAIFWGMLAQNVSLAITVLWMILAVGRSWRTAPLWSDRCGRIAGFGWISFALVATPLASSTAGLILFVPDRNAGPRCVGLTTDELGVCTPGPWHCPCRPASPFILFADLAVDSGRSYLAASAVVAPSPCLIPLALCRCVLFFRCSQSPCWLNSMTCSGTWARGPSDPLVVSR